MFSAFVLIHSIASACLEIKVCSTSRTLGGGAAAMAGMAKGMPTC